MFPFRITLCMFQICTHFPTLKSAVASVPDARSCYLVSNKLVKNCLNNILAYLLQGCVDVVANKGYSWFLASYVKWYLPEERSVVLVMVFCSALD